jgi:AcrR family transcriptional regulator
LCICAIHYHMTTKDLILSEARKVFEKFGFNKTSMTDIALAARKGRRTIYSYFTSKEEVFKAVIEVEIDALAKTLEELIARAIPADEKLREYMHMRMNAVKRLTIYYDAIRRDLSENLAIIEMIRKKYDEKEMEMIRQILDEGVAQNIFDIKDTQMVAGAIVLASKGFELPLIMGQEGYDHSQMITPLIDVFYQGIKKNNH